MAVTLLLHFLSLSAAELLIEFEPFKVSVFRCYAL